jgi:hypothetical protein
VGGEDGRLFVSVCVREMKSGLALVVSARKDMRCSYCSPTDQVFVSRVPCSQENRSTYGVCVCVCVINDPHSSMAWDAQSGSASQRRD